METLIALGIIVWVFGMLFGRSSGSSGEGGSSAGGTTVPPSNSSPPPRFNQYGEREP